VPAIRVRLDVTWLHRRDRPDGHCLLPDAKVRRALDLAAHEELLDLLLEDPDPQHLLKPLLKLVVRDLRTRCG
jgi:hypothetical protein